MRKWKVCKSEGEGKGAGELLNKKVKVNKCTCQQQYGKLKK